MYNKTRIQPVPIAAALLVALGIVSSACQPQGLAESQRVDITFSVSENIPTLREKTATKAPKVYTGATADVQALDFAVWAYNMPSAGSLPAGWLLDGGTGSTPVKASYNSEKDDWRPAGNIKYNTSQRASTWQARWFALGPWAAYNGSTANVSGLTPADGSAPAPRYTVPSGSLVATRHYDLLAAVSADRAVGTTTPVSLNFCHVLTGIRFKREKDLNITDITVSGVYDRADLAMEKIPADGDLTAFVNVDNEGDDADLWSARTRSVAAPSFSMAPASWTNGRPGNPAAETQWDYAAGDGDIMMMIPQFTPAGAKITVTIDGVPVSGDISGHRWLPGRLVTYAITRGDDFLTWELSVLGEDIIWENEYILEGTVPATLSYPAEGGELTLATDFRSCIEDGEQTVPESFVFQYSDTDAGPWTDGLPDWLSSPGTSLDGAATATTLSLTAAANDSGAARTVHVRLQQPASGKTTSACEILQFPPGKFTVNEQGKQVYFAPGNLVVTYRSSGNHEWAFEQNQWDYSYGTGAGESYEGQSNYEVDGTRISHFGWATAGVKNGTNNYGYDPHHEHYQPYSIAGFDIDNGGGRWYSDNYFARGPSVSTTEPYVWANAGGANLPYGNVEGNSWNYGSAWNTVRPYCDWGVHFNEKGEGDNGRTDGIWYTLSAYEWDYLFNRRDNSTALVGKGRIYVEAENKYVNGLIILPDNWVLPSGCSPFTSGTTRAYETNLYTTGDADDSFKGQWSEMEAAGAAFLPAAGQRTTTDNSTRPAWDFEKENIIALYWSSSAHFYNTNHMSTYSYYIHTYISGMDLQPIGLRYIGHSVRLVRDCDPQPVVVPQYVFEGTVPATQSVAAAGGNVTFATNFLSYVNNGLTNTARQFEFQYSTNGTSGWTTTPPNWIAPANGTSTDGCTSATTLSLTATANTGTTARSVYVRLQQPASGKTTSACQITQNVLNYILEGTVPATQSIGAVGGDITLATNFLSYVNNGLTNTARQFEFQYSTNGTSGWTTTPPNWIAPANGTSTDGCTSATTLSLTATANAGTTVRSMYVRLQQPASGKTTSACKITQNGLDHVFEGNFATSRSASYKGGDIILATDFRSCMVDGTYSVPNSYVIQYSTDGTSGWTTTKPNWLSPAPGTDLNGATTATTLKLRATSLANGGSLRSVYVRAYQPSTGNASAVCFVRQLTSAYVNGRFSVSASKQVWFARGNLFVNVNANPRVWKFEDEQYKTSGYMPPLSSFSGPTTYEHAEEHNGGYSVSGRGISHFGWATAGFKKGTNYGYDAHHIYYEPSSIAGEPNETQRDEYARYTDNYYGYGPSVNAANTRWAANLPFDMVEGNSWNKNNTVKSYCEWGLHFNDNGIGANTTTTGSWYTLSAAEWDYLLKRSNGSKCAFAQIYVAAENTTVNGIVILPDEWELPSGCTFNANTTGVTAYTDNKYTTGTNTSTYNGGIWSAMEEAGAVFLPAIGHRTAVDPFFSNYNMWYFRYGNAGGYWSSSASNRTAFSYISLRAYYLYFVPRSYYSTQNAIQTTTHLRCVGLCVRLVHD